jgi:hypothetical protein
MSVYPEVRVYADPFEGLTVQLTELRGLIKLVPPLIEADRERRWKEISESPSDGEDGDVIETARARSRVTTTPIAFNSPYARTTVRGEQRSRPAISRTAGSRGRELRDEICDH